MGSRLLSVIVLCLDEEENIFPFYEEFIKNKEFLDGRGIGYELIFVDGGSGDNTSEMVSKLHDRDPSVGLLSLSNDFGKEASMYAGLKAASGNLVCIMDADLRKKGYKDGRKSRKVMVCRKVLSSV